MAGTSVLRLKDDPRFKNEPEIRSFVAWLHKVGYSQSRAVAMQRVAAAFVHWLQTKPSSIAEADEGHVAAFLKRSAGRSKKPRVSEGVALQRFLEHRRAQVPLSTRPSMTKTSVDAAIEQRYVDYLRQERGLTERSVQVYLPYIRRFLTTRAAATGATLVPSTLNAGEVREFLLNRCRARSSEYSRLLAVALRSFLCFLFLRGETKTDLSLAIPKVLRWSRATVPNHLSLEQVEQIIAASDRTIPTGRRDHAVLLLLARLGLRAGEVVALDLGDIRWRTGSSSFAGKGAPWTACPCHRTSGKPWQVTFRTIVVPLPQVGSFSAASRLA
jgi:integrase/recombinase XerD